MQRIEVKRLAIVQRAIGAIAAFAIAEAQQIEDIRMLGGGVNQCVEIGNRRLEVLGLDLGTDGGQIRRRAGFG